jgi:hypothetical protein
MLEKLQRDGQIDVHGYYLHRKLYESAHEASLMPALGDWRGPSLLVQIQTRRKLTSTNAELAAAMEANGARVHKLSVLAEPGWSFVSNPAWRSEALHEATVEWLDAMA